MPFLIALAGVGHLRLLFALSPAYTCLVSLKATGPAWKPEYDQAHLRPLAILALFLRPNLFMAVRSGQLRGWPTPDHGISTPRSIRRLSRGNDWRRFLNLDQETIVMTVSACPVSNLAEILLPVYLIHSKDPSLAEEIDDRLSTITAALDYIESASDYAALHRFDLQPDSLAGVARLIRREAAAAVALFAEIRRLEGMV